MITRFFDRDELGDDPEEDDEELQECCPECMKPWEECECDDDEGDE